MKVSIMQPYFFPYAGYFRLLSACDKIIFLDCVQFPRRGWVHRNRLSNQQGELDWLTLSLVKGHRDTTLIQDLRFPRDAQELFKAQFARFPVLHTLESKAPELFYEICDLGTDVTAYLIKTLTLVADKLNIGRPWLRSSELGISPELRAQDRIIAIAKAVGASDYVNLAGGVDLYDDCIFQEQGLKLHFLQDYKGSFTSILERILQENLADIRDEIVTNCNFSNPK